MESPQQAPSSVPSIPDTRPTEPVFPWSSSDILTPPPTGAPPFSFPPYFRISTTILPSSKEVASKCGIPFAVIFEPTLPASLREVDCTSLPNVIRCAHCSGYLCPQAQVSGDGRHWQCPICQKSNQVPPDHNGTFQELTDQNSLVYDVIAPPCYARDTPTRPVFLFAIDVSSQSWSIGLAQQMIATLTSSLDSIPAHFLIGLLTMNDRLTIFNLYRRSQIVLSDLSDVSISLPLAELLLPAGDAKSAILDAFDVILSQPPLEPVGHCLGSLYQVAHRLLSRTGGHLFACLTGLPSHGPFPLKLRSQSGAGEVAMLRPPEDKSGHPFRDLAFQLNHAGASVHLFIAGPDFADVSVAAIPAGLTCGSVFYSPEFDAAGRTRMHDALFAALTSDYMWDVTARLRASAGIVMKSPLANCVLRSDSVVSPPVIGRSRGIVIEFAVEGNLAHPAVLQTGVVYTDAAGRRRIRVCTFSVPVSPDPTVVLRAVDEAALFAVLAREFVAATLAHGPVSAAERTSKVVKSILGQGVAFKFNSLYHLCHALLGHPIAQPVFPSGTDGRMATLIFLRGSTLRESLLFFYPRMFAADGVEGPLPMCADSFGAGSCFVVHAIDGIFVWVSQAASPEYLERTFGVTAVENLPAEIPVLQTPESARLNAIVAQCWEFVMRYVRVEVIGQGSPREAIFRDLLVDELLVGGANLVEWIRHLS
jgi:protein transport protein SEC24